MTDARSLADLCRPLSAKVEPRRIDHKGKPLSPDHIRATARRVAAQPKPPSRPLPKDPAP